MPRQAAKSLVWPFVGVLRGITALKLRSLKPFSTEAPSSYDGVVTEKRAYRRYPIWFPVTIHLAHGGGEREVWAICRDASARGVLVSAIAPIDVGTAVTARFRVHSAKSPERTIRSRVVREESPEEELTLVFPSRFALEFEEPVALLVDELAAQSEKVLAE